MGRSRSQSSHDPEDSVHHDHGHPHGEHDFVKANRVHFDKTATKYDEPDKADFAKNAVAAMLKKYDFKVGETTALDFACGTGLMAREVIPHVRKVVGVDISQGMVDQFNARVKDLGLPENKIFATAKDITDKPDDMAQMFDVAVCSMAYHHIEALDNITFALMHTLKPNGVLFVFDLMTPTGNTPPSPLFSEEYNHQVVHRYGFDEKTMRGHYEAAGFVDIKYEPTAIFKFHGKDLQAFIASGREAAD